MRKDQNLDLLIEGDAGETPLAFAIGDVILAGYSGRDPDSVRHHFDELRDLGLEPPAETPILFRVSDYLVTTRGEVTVQDPTTSGEVEFVLLLAGEETYVTVGSDHTSRSMERHSIPSSKQMYPKVLAPRVWRFAHVREGWDDIILRSWADGVRYQEGRLGDLLETDVLIDAVERRLGLNRTGTVLMSGTIPTLEGRMAYAKRFDFEIDDAVRGRRIRHGYDVRPLDPPTGAPG